MLITSHVVRQPRREQESINRKGYLLAAFMNIEDIFNNVEVDSISGAMNRIKSLVGNSTKKRAVKRG